jgi:Domain of Unknown Function (DUF928)
MIISSKLQKTSLKVIATTIGLTWLLSITTAVARQKIVFIPPTLSGPRRLIPAGTRVYDPASEGYAGRNSELPPAPAPPSVFSPVKPLDGLQNARVNEDNPVVQRKAPVIQTPENIQEVRPRARVSSTDKCLQGPLPLTALIPESQLGLTTVADPTLFFYIPQTSAPELELIVQNENEQEIFKQKYKPNNKAGIISLHLPVNSLAINKQYKWKLSLICNPADKSQNKFVAGLIQRVLPDPQLARKLQQVTKQERAALYAEAGIWQDTLATLAQMRYLVPNNQELATEWSGLITGKGVGLNEQIAQQPLISEPEALKPKKYLKF